MAAYETARCERSEWRAVACALGMLLLAFGAGWLYSARVHGIVLGWPAVITFAIGMGWLTRAIVGWHRGSTQRIDGPALDSFRERCFWCMPARCSYAAVLICDGLFLLDLWPDRPALFFLFAALAALFSARIAVLSGALGASFLL